MQITGIIGAMDIEVTILRSMMKNARTETVSGIDFIIGSLEGRRVVLARSGVGKVFAALCAQTMILKFGVTEIVNSGVAGTLTPELHIGDVAISTACVQHDMDTSAVGDPVGLISGIITAAASIGGYAYIVEISPTLGSLWQMLMGTALVPLENVWPTSSSTRPSAAYGSSPPSTLPPSKWRPPPSPRSASSTRSRLPPSASSPTRPAATSRSTT